MQIPIQGVLRDSAGLMPPDGQYPVTFALHSQSVGGAVLWSESWPPQPGSCSGDPGACVEVVGGVFDAMLGSHAELDTDLFGLPQLWLGTTVMGEPEMLPRRPLGSVPFAFHSGSAGVAGALACTGCIDAAALSPAAIDLVRDEAVSAATDAGFVTPTSPGFDWALGDAPGGQALVTKDADTLMGFAPNPSGTPLPGTVPVTGPDGRIPESLMPFEPGALVAPGERELLATLEAYGTTYFHIEGLGIDDGLAKHVKAGVSFGPGNGIVGSLGEAVGVGWWDDPERYAVYDDFAQSEIASARWSIELYDQGWWGSGAIDAAVVASNKAMGSTPELHLGESTKLASVVAVHNRGVFLRYRLVFNSSLYGSFTAHLTVAGVSIQHSFSPGATCSGCQCGADFPGAVLVVAKGEDLYDVYSNLALVAEDVYKPEGVFLYADTAYAAGSNWEQFGHVYLDDIRIARTSAVGEYLSCDDDNPCTDDYIGGPSEQDCSHPPNSVPCNDGTACTTGDTCSDTVCVGTSIPCVDDSPFTLNGVCDPQVGCLTEHCTVADYQFEADADGWSLGSDWIYEDGALVGSGNTLTASSPGDFSGPAEGVLLRFKCLGGDGLTLFPGGIDLPCTYDGEYEVREVDLNTTAFSIQLAHHGSGSVKIDWVQALEVCE